MTRTLLALATLLLAGCGHAPTAARALQAGVVQARAFSLPMISEATQSAPGPNHTIQLALSDATGQHAWQLVRVDRQHTRCDWGTVTLTIDGKVQPKTAKAACAKVLDEAMLTRAVKDAVVKAAADDLRTGDWPEAGGCGLL